MKKFTIRLNALLILSTFAFSTRLNAQFTQGRLVVYQVGDGSTALSAASAPTFLKEYTTAGAAGISVAMPVTGGARLTNSGSATTEGLITLASNGQYIIIPGYDAPVATATVGSTTSGIVNRVIDSVSFLAIPGRAAATATFFSGSAERGAASDGNNNYWADGAASGICYLGSGTPAAVSTTSTNNRALNIYNNKLYFSTGAGTHGIYRVGAGAPPTTSGNVASIFIPTGSTSSPYQFSMNATSDTCYVADDQANSSGGIQKWIFNGTSWSLAYTLGTGVSNIGARGLTVDWSSTPNPIIYTTSAEGSANRIIKITDAGAGSPATTLATASTNTIFRGITFAPYCTPVSFSSITSNGPICTNQTLNLDATINGTKPIGYQWNGAGSFSSTTVKNPTVTGASSGIYTLTVTNSCGVSTNTINVVVNNTPTVSASATSTLVCAGDAVTLSGIGATSYTWTNGVTDNVAFNPVTTQTYVVTGTDLNNCTNTATVTVNVNALPVVTATPNPTSVCLGGNLTLTGGGATTFTWSSGVSDGVSFTPTVTATYTVTGTDNNNCVNSATVNVAINNLPTVTANPNPSAVCMGSNLTLSGGGASTYTWSSGVTDGVAFTPTVTADYTVTGTDANNCINTATVNVVVNNLPNVSASASATLVCAGDGVTLNGSGAATYTWSNGVTDNVAFNPTSSNTYTVMGTDANNCSNTTTITVNTNPLPIISVNSGTICVGQQTATLTANGAITYSWSPATGLSSNTGATVTANPGTTIPYVVTGTDVNGCVGSATTTVTVNALPTISVNSETICPGFSATLTPTGAQTYTWNTGATSASLSDSPVLTTTYTVTGTDMNGCINANTATITVNPSMNLAAANNSAICAGATLNFFASPGITWSWSGPGGYSSTLQNPVILVSTLAMSGDYTVSATDANGCSETAVTSVTVNPLPIVQANYAPNDTICIGNSVTLSGGGAMSYTWNGGVSDGIAFSPTVTATYTVNGSDANGCSDSAWVQIVVDPCSSAINSLSNSPMINCYPNPATDKLTIISVNIISQLKITNVLGETVYESASNRTEEVIDLSGLQNGNYFLQVVSQNGMSSRKIIVQK